MKFLALDPGGLTPLITEPAIRSWVSHNSHPHNVFPNTNFNIISYLVFHVTAFQEFTHKNNVWISCFPIKSTCPFHCKLCLTLIYENEFWYCKFKFYENINVMDMKLINFNSYLAKYWLRFVMVFLSMCRQILG